MLPSSLQNAKVALVGWGVSSRAVLARLVFEGVPGRNVTVYTPLPTEDPAARSLGVSFATGMPTEAEVIFRSPGVPPHTLPRIPGAMYSSECELFLARCPCPVLGITGSDGKTTTATLLHRMLKEGAKEAGGRFCAHLGGNIGNSLLSALPHMKKEDLAVLELSSFQLADLTPRLAAGAITNLTENHLNWHKDMADYARCKGHLALGAERRVLNFEDPFSRSFENEGALLYAATAGEDALPRDRDCLFFRGDTVFLRPRGASARPLLSARQLLLPGVHGKQSLLCALGLALPYVSPAAAERALVGFSGVSHRMERLPLPGPVGIYDSSADTTPSRTATTLAAMKERPVVLLGGSGKGVSFDALGPVLENRAAAAVLYGETAEQIDLVLKESRLPHFRTEDLCHALPLGLALALGMGRPLLLSPACASFDGFRDYRHRGECFRQWAAAHLSLLEFETTK